MYKTNLFLFILFFVSFSLYSQEKAQKAPLNPDFLQYQKQKKALDTSLTN